MRTLLRRSVAAITAIALILWGSDGLEASGVRLWFTYGSIAAGTLLAYYALTGRTLLPPREPKE
jgi:hypothetical protein